MFLHKRVQWSVIVTCVIAELGLGIKRDTTGALVRWGSRGTRRSGKRNTRNRGGKGARGRESRKLRRRGSERDDFVCWTESWTLYYCMFMTGTNETFNCFLCDLLTYTCIMTRCLTIGTKEFDLSSMWTS